MKITLLTSSRKLVARFVIPEMVPGPEVLMWGTRVFTRADEELADTRSFGEEKLKERTVNYVEGMAYFIFDSSKKWEPADE